MITMIHTPAAEATHAAEKDEDYYRIPAGGRWMPMDWDRIGQAFESASQQLGWDADFELIPERQRVIVRFSPDHPESLGRRMLELQRHVSKELGMEQYMSIWIDFLSRR